MVDPENAEESERDALKQLTAIIKERDPDVIEGHDLFRFDLPYLVARARKAKVKLDWGRSGGFLRSRPSRLQIAEKTIDYPKFQVDGRHFVDTFLLAQFYDVGMRALSGFERIDVAQHFGFCDTAEISALTGKALQREYLRKSERFRKRALCAVRETRAMADLLSPSYFIQAQIFPYNYQDVIVRGNATRINALFLREYLRQRHSIPEMPMARNFEGGFTAIYFTGVARNVWHCDVASLYPSIMLQFDCFPVTDQLQIFRHLLTDLRSFRLEAKGQMQSADKEGNRPKWHHLHALQNTFKILINSFYGYLGFAQGHFADFDAAARVTQIGRDLLQKMIAWLTERGAQVIEVDTDGIYFVPPSSSPDSFVEAGVSPAKARGDAADTAATTTEIDQLRQGLAKELPPGIEVEFDEQFDAMFSYKAKNYALLTRGGEVIIKGGALKSRGLEKFQRVFLEEMIKLIMQGKPEEIAELRDQFEQTNSQSRIADRNADEDRHPPGFVREISGENCRLGAQSRRRLRAGVGQRPRLSTRRPDQLLHQSDAEESRRLRSGQTASEFDPQNRDENSRLLRRQARRTGQEIQRNYCGGNFCEAREPGIVAGRDHPGAVTMQKKRASSPLNGNIGECCQVTSVA